MEKIKLASGKLVSVDMVAVIPNPPIMYVRVVNLTMPDIASVFSNPAETQMIVSGNRTFYGYTKLEAIIDEGDAIRVNLRRA